MGGVSAAVCCRGAHIQRRSGRGYGGRWGRLRVRRTGVCGAGVGRMGAGGGAIGCKTMSFLLHVL